MASPCSPLLQAVQPSTGSMIYDEFQDSLDSFSELETRLAQIQPVEILYPLDCSPKLKQSLLDWKNYSDRSGYLKYSLALVIVG